MSTSALLGGIEAMRSLMDDDTIAEKMRSLVESTTKFFQVPDASITINFWPIIIAVVLVIAGKIIIEGYVCIITLIFIITAQLQRSPLPSTSWFRSTACTRRPTLATTAAATTRRMTTMTADMTGRGGKKMEQKQRKMGQNGEKIM